jgi:hypothetical protein
MKNPDTPTDPTTPTGHYYPALPHHVAVISALEPGLGSETGNQQAQAIVSEYCDNIRQFIDRRTPDRLVRTPAAIELCHQTINVIERCLPTNRVLAMSEEFRASLLEEISSCFDVITNLHSSPQPRYRVRPEEVAAAAVIIGLMRYAIEYPREMHEYEVLPTATKLFECLYRWPFKRESAFRTITAALFFTNSSVYQDTIRTQNNSRVRRYTVSYLFPYGLQANQTEPSEQETPDEE